MITLFLIAVLSCCAFSLDSFTVAKTFTDADTIYASDMNKNPDSMAAWSGRLIDSIDQKFIRSTGENKLTIDTVAIKYLDIDSQVIGTIKADVFSVGVYYLTPVSGALYFQSSGSTFPAVFSAAGNALLGNSSDRVDSVDIAGIKRMYNSGSYLYIQTGNDAWFRIPSSSAP